MSSIAAATSELVAAPRQRSKPLFPVRGVISIIDRNEDQVLALLEDGKIAWAFDVAAKRQRGHSRELRVLPVAVAAYMRGDTCALEWPDVLGMLVPDSPTVLATEVSRVLNVSSTHVYNLIGRKMLRACSKWKTGPDGSARIATDNFAHFLKSRRFP